MRNPRQVGDLRHRSVGSLAASWDLDELCAVLVERDHAALNRMTASIRHQLAELAGADLVSPLKDARAIFDDIGDRLRAHMAKEENILFPALAALAHARRDRLARPALPFPTVLHPIRVMETEHERVAELLTRLRAMAGTVVPPAGSERLWRRCVREVEALDGSMRAHMRFEDDVLFPRALELERLLP